MHLYVSFFYHKNLRQNLGCILQSKSCIAKNEIASVFRDLEFKHSKKTIIVLRKSSLFKEYNFQIKAIYS